MKATSSALPNMKKLDRKTVERNRRIHMKGLCFRLTSLIPPHHLKLSKEFLSQQGQLDQATDYIKQLKERIDELSVKKEVLTLMSQNGNSSHPISASFTVPVVELRESGSSNIEVLVVSDKAKNIRLCDVVKVLQEEGADVVSTNISRVGDRVFHTLHAQLSMELERLLKLEDIVDISEVKKLHEEVRDLKMDSSNAQLVKCQAEALSSFVEGYGESVTCFARFEPIF